VFRAGQRGSGHGVAVDARLVDQRADLLDGAQVGVAVSRGGLEALAIDQAVVDRAVERGHFRRAVPGGTCRHREGLEQSDASPPFGQPQCAEEPREAAAHHDGVPVGADVAVSPVHLASGNRCGRAVQPHRGCCQGVEMLRHGGSGTPDPRVSCVPGHASPVTRTPVSGRWPLDQADRTSWRCRRGPSSVVAWSRRTSP
jgi:hypothetical protein